MKYFSIIFITSFFIYISVVGLKECPKEEEPIDTEYFDWTESADHEVWRTNFEVKELY